MKSLSVKFIFKVKILLPLVAILPLKSSAVDFESAADAVTHMRVGWNLGNTLESHSGDVNGMWIEGFTDF